MRLLVVEDYAPLRRSLEQGLREAGHAVDATGDGEEGLWYATGADYDVIILDLMLPGLDGLTILRRLREGGRDTHVLVLTARDAVDDRVRGLNLGADDYLVKPFAFAELLARIETLVRRRYQQKSMLVDVGDLKIDRGSRRVRRAGKALTLTARQYALLDVLALRAGQVVSRQELWTHLYDANAEPNWNLLEVHVGRLRRALEADGAPRILHTRRGIGYCLGGEA